MSCCFPTKQTDQCEASFLQRTKPHPEAARQRSQRMNFALEHARKLMAGNIPPAYSRYAASASPLGPSGAGANGVPACTRQLAQARWHGTRQPAPKSQNSGGTLSIGQGFEASASFAGGQSTFIKGSVGFLQYPPLNVTPNTNIEYSRIFLRLTRRLFRRKCMTLMSWSELWLSTVKFSNWPRHCTTSVWRHVKVRPVN